jgi:hypothetical protein
MQPDEVCDTYDGYNDIDNTSGVIVTCEWCYIYTCELCVVRPVEYIILGSKSLHLS